MFSYFPPIILLLGAILLPLMSLLLPLMSLLLPLLLLTPLLPLLLADYTGKVIGMMWSTLAQLQTWFGNEPWKSYGIQVTRDEYTVLYILMIIPRYHEYTRIPPCIYIDSMLSTLNYISHDLKWFFLTILLYYIWGLIILTIYTLQYT